MGIGVHIKTKDAVWDDIVVMITSAHISPTCIVLAIATIFLAIARTEVGSPIVLCGRRVGSRRWARCNRKPNCVKMPPHNPYQRCLYGAPDTSPEPPVERYSNGLSLRGGYYGKM